MYIQSDILRFIRPSCQLLSFKILEYRFSNNIFANDVQELCFQVLDLVMSNPPHTNHDVIYYKGLSTKTRRWNISHRPVIGQAESIPKLLLVQVEPHLL